MKNLKMFCTTLDPNHYNFIKELGYIPVGLGDKDFNNEWLRDNSGINISKKNKNYAECTFHYWFWKNYLNTMENEWIGFCHYRKFWSTRGKDNKISSETLKNNILQEIPKDYEKYDVILGEPFFVDQLRTMKFLKNGFKIVIKNPLVFFKKKKRNLNFHFDLMHGENNLQKAINLLDKENQEDFRNFVKSEVSFNPFHMLICKSKKILNDYYKNLFPWLEKCENLFKFDDLKGYGKIRIYAFLAERFMSYWFQKNTQFKTMPIIFYDLKNN